MNLRRFLGQASDEECQDYLAQVCSIDVFEIVHVERKKKRVN